MTGVNLFSLLLPETINGSRVEGEGGEWEGEEDEEEGGEGEAEGEAEGGAEGETEGASTVRDGNELVRLRLGFEVGVVFG